MKKFSYLALILGIIFIMIEIICTINGTIGCILTSIGAICILGEVILNNKLREFFINMIFNLF